MYSTASLCVYIANNPLRKVVRPQIVPPRFPQADTPQIPTRITYQHVKDLSNRIEPTCCSYSPYSAPPSPTASCYSSDDVTPPTTQFPTDIFDIDHDYDPSRAEDGDAAYLTAPDAPAPPSDLASHPVLGSRGRIICWVSDRPSAVLLEERIAQGRMSEVAISALGDAGDVLYVAPLRDGLMVTDSMSEADEADRATRDFEQELYNLETEAAIRQVEADTAGASSGVASAYTRSNLWEGWAMQRPACTDPETLEAVRRCLQARAGCNCGQCMARSADGDGDEA